jgi:hypothetical protein
VGHLEGGSNAGDVAHPQSRYWQVFASLITATESEPAFITLRYEDVTERELTLVADEPPKDVYGSPVVQLGEVLALAGLGAFRPVASGAASNVCVTSAWSTLRM